MKLKSLLVMMFTIGAVECIAQSDTLTLKRCIEIGIENNLTLQQKQQDIHIAEIGQSENRHKLIPVIQGYANFVHNVERATSVTDGSNLSKLLGVDAPYMVGQGLDFQTTGGFQLSMPLYNQTLYTGIQIADKMKEISEASYEKAKEDLTVEISKLYYLAQTTAKQIELIRSNIGRMESLKSITSAFYDNDMALKVDVQRVDINLENLRTQLTNAEAMYEQQLNLLRYTLDFAPDTPILLSTLKGYIDYDDSYLLRGLSPDLYEMQLLNMQSEVLQKQKKMINQGYLPTLSLVGATQWTAFTDKFENYFHTHPTNKWYNHTYWGLQLNVPIFDGLAKRNKSRKVAAQYTQLQTTIADTEKKLQTQYQNSLNDWHNNIRNAERQRENYRLAESVYLVTSDQYKEGVASMSDLLQDEMRMTEAQNGYISALYKYMVSELSLLKLTGQLNRLTE
ncbi:MAG: TolC family protein [Bacteroidaceae bacterium]|nr:TolC family protein [Bacteroidaceae bacterium]